MKSLLGVGAFAAVMLSASTLQAETFTLQNCPSCLGGIYTVEATQSAAQVADNFWHIAWTLDLTGVNESNISYLSAIGIKVAGPSGVENFPVSYSLTQGSEFGPSIDGPNWSLLTNSGVNSSGCSGSGSGWLCLGDDGSSGMRLSTGSVYTWAFDIDLIAGVKPGLDGGVIALGGNFDPANGRILSDDAQAPVQTVPEPATLLLLGVGLAGAGMRRSILARRR